MNNSYVDVEIFPGVAVEVYPDGRIKSKSHSGIRKNGRRDNRKGRFLRASIDRYGYERIVISSRGGRKTLLVHRLVATAFIPNIDNKPTVNHIDGDKRNNCLENLEWATYAEQKAHAIKTNLCEENIRKLGEANVARSRRVVYDGVEYPSIRFAARATGIDRKKIAREGVFIND